MTPRETWGLLRVSRVFDLVNEGEKDEEQVDSVRVRDVRFGMRYSGGKLVRRDISESKERSRW